MDAELGTASTGDTPERLLTVSEVARLLAISVRTVWRLRDTGELPQPVRVSRNLLRWRLSEIDAYMRRGSTARSRQGSEDEQGMDNR